MGGFFYTSKAIGDVKTVLANSRKHFKNSGFRTPLHFETKSYCIDYYSKIHAPVSNYVQFDDDNFILSVGTFIYRGLIGPDALKLLYAKADQMIELREARGHFVVILRKAGQTHLFRDPLAALEVFITQDGGCLTTSFLAAASAAGHCTINTHETYEYVFNGVTLGTKTPFAEVCRLDLFEQLKLEPTLTLLHERFELCPPEQKGSFSELVEHNLRGLQENTSVLSGLFGDNIKLALSGGYDSRLLFALFRNCGITPQLFVYGTEDDPDVRVAKSIACAEGVKIHHLNKAVLSNVTPETYPSTVRNNFFFEDALNSDGIFVSDAEQIARAERSASGALHVNGGGGEIFRNFFYLFDRSLSVRELVWTFYSRFDPAECSALFDTCSYEEAIASKVVALLGLKGTRLRRREVESLYPYFRCRSWFGRENSVNNRYAYSILPFLEYGTVREALRIPIRYKHFGNFENALIRHADAALSRYRSHYGYDFTKDTPASAVGHWLLTYIRPPWLRRLSFRIKSWTQAPSPRPPLLSQPYLSRVIDTKFPYMNKYFRIGRVTSNLHFARICTLEYLFSEFSAH